MARPETWDELGYELAMKRSRTPRFRQYVDRLDAEAQTADPAPVPASDKVLTQEERDKEHLQCLTDIWHAHTQFLTTRETLAGMASYVESAIADAVKLEQDKWRLLWEMLTGILPFTDEEMQAIHDAVAAEREKVKQSGAFSRNV